MLAETFLYTQISRPIHGHKTKQIVFGRTHINKYFFNDAKKLDEKIIKYFEDNIFMLVCSKTIYLVLWS